LAKYAKLRNVTAAISRRNNMSLLNEARLETLMDRAGLDLLVATSPANVFYASNYRSLGQWILPGVEVYVAIPRIASAPRALIAPVGEIDLVAETKLDVTEVIPYGMFSYTRSTSGSEDLSASDLRLIELGIDTTAHNSPLEALVAYVQAQDLATGRLGIDEMGVSPARYQEFQAALSSASLEPAYGTWQQIRMVKTEKEIDRLRRANAIAATAFKTTLEEYREGVTERELAAVYNQSLIKHGAQPTFTVIGIGSHSAYPNAAITDRELRKGDIVRYDIGCAYEGYHADIARTVIFGSPSSKLEACYEAILVGEETAIERIRPGLTPDEIFDIAMTATRQAGIPHYERNHVGHGIGVDVYDPPVLRQGLATPIEAGMVLNVETPYYEIGWGGLQVEDAVLVTETGSEYLTELDRTLFVV
jgi:Xaa-Pro dipeptidase